jgi:7-carboxy-7-deazaguanine synthase
MTNRINRNIKASDTVSDQLNEGKLLPLVESFYTIQGEGFNTGKAAYFIRLGGCDVGCSWCDSKESWNPAKFPPVNIEKIISEVERHPAKSIVITGGEPLKYPLDPLCNALAKKGLEIFLETSGSEKMSGRFDWICLSPKKRKEPLKENYQSADELKVIIEYPDDIAWAEECAGKVRKNCLLYLQPEWSKRESIMPVLVNYAMAHPQWMISLQTHKYLHIP